MLRNDPLGQPHDLVGALRVESGGVLVEQQELGDKASALLGRPVRSVWRPRDSMQGDGLSMMDY